MYLSSQSGRSVMERKPPSGGKGGGMFDSGCNLSGITRISIECGSFYWDHQEYKSTLKRLFVEFNEKNFDKDATFWGYGVASGSSKTFTLDFASHERIVKAVVWADDKLANAVQFHLASGDVTPMYGIPAKGAKPTTFSGEDGSQLVGMYGRFGAVIDSIGFAFASTEDVHIPESVESWNMTNEDQTDD